MSMLSTLGNIFGAGIGTFASTLFALYLATIVETSAHESLYNNFPYKYANIPEDELPVCIKDREISRREIQAEVAATQEKVREEDDSPKLHLLKTTSLWESWMAEERARIAKEETRMFEEEARMFAELLPAKELLAMNVSNNSITNNRCEEIKRIRQAEARKFREQLTSLAMTA
jgi:hypothetical protein